MASAPTSTFASRPRRPSRSTRATALVLVALLSLAPLLGCGGSDDGDSGELALFPPQTFSDDFDGGSPGARWGCAGGACSWDVVEAAEIFERGDGGASPALAGAVPMAGGSTNYLFQSPDPEALNPNRSMYCESFSADFEQSGTIAFDYLVDTAPPITFGQDGNQLTVEAIRSEWVYYPEFDEELPEHVSRETILTAGGQEASRFYRVLEPGLYDFMFCYERNRTFEIGPDYVQIDNVDTCVGSNCIGELPRFARCLPDRGDVLVPTTGVPSRFLTITRVLGTDDRYYIIVDPYMLDLFYGGFLAAGEDYSDLAQASLDLLNKLDIDGVDCDLDGRMVLEMQLTDEELEQFLADSGLIDAAFVEANELYENAIEPLVDSIYAKMSAFFWKTIFGTIINKIITSAIKAAV